MLKYFWHAGGLSVTSGMSIHERDYMRDEPPSFGERMRSVSAFHWVFWLNIGVFIAQWVFRVGMLHDAETGEYLPLGGVSVDALTQGQVWTPFTYMFVHGSAGHILLNMLMLWFAGKRVQDLYGPRHFVLIYVVSGLVGAGLEMALGAYVLGSTGVYLVGASASIMGLLLAYAIAMPEEEITLLLAFIIPVRARLWTLAKFLLLLNVVCGALALLHMLPEWLSGGGGAVAYFAHVGGALAGWYYARSLGYGGLPPDLGHGWGAQQPHLRRRRPALARTRRPVVDVDLEAARRQNPKNDSVVDLMRDEVDPILDKITDQGIHSLTDEERRILERASRQIIRQGGKR